MRKSAASSRAARPRSTSRKYRPKKCVILGKKYRIDYCPRMFGVNPDTPDDPSHASINIERGIIRVHDGGREWHEVFGDLLHEVMHAITDEMGGPFDTEEHHDDLNRMAIVLADTLYRNGWLREADH